MRSAYREELSEITAGLEQMARLAESAVGRATTALLDADVHLAETVVSADRRIDELQRGLENQAIAVLARQQPVATELRAVVTALRISADLERAGDLALNLAKLARRRFPDSAVPADLQATVLEMGHVAQRRTLNGLSWVGKDSTRSAKRSGSNWSLDFRKDSRALAAWQDWHAWRNGTPRSWNPDQTQGR